MTFREFAVVRIIRLYPMYILGTIIGITSGAITLILGKGHLTAWEFFVSAITAVLMLPAPVGGESFAPLNIPAWSLYYELLLNFGYALLARQLRPIYAVAIAIVSGTTLAAIVIANGTVFTVNNWHFAAFGFCRALFPYSVGVLLSLLPRYRSPIISPIGYVLPLLPLFVFMAHGQDAVVIELIAIVIAFPVIVFAAINLDVRNPEIFQFLGLTSYAIYIIHAPILLLFSRVLAASRTNIDHAAVPTEALLIFMLLVLAALLDKFYDLPARSWLTKSAQTTSEPKAASASSRA